ncbi:MAG TPA: hypothetical protein VEC60_03280 [Reyranella sp.]|nr:hypothetical protein [Reyranella sp.]
MRSFALATVAALSLVLVACGSSDKKDAPVAEVPSGQKVVIKKGVWDAFINYKHWIMPKSYAGPVGNGYFAVTEDGSGWGLTGCPDTYCEVGSLTPQAAINECSTRNGGRACLVFAKQDKIVVPYEIAQ